MNIFFLSFWKASFPFQPPCFLPFSYLSSNVISFSIYFLLTCLLYNSWLLLSCPGFGMIITLVVHSNLVLFRDVVTDNVFFLSSWERKNRFLVSRMDLTHHNIRVVCDLNMQAIFTFFFLNRLIVTIQKRSVMSVCIIQVHLSFGFSWLLFNVNNTT